MPHRRQRYPKQKRRFGKSHTTQRLKAAADSGLRKVFASIGVPPRRPFVPDSFQDKAVAAIEQSDCLVTAPTGAGKTWIAETAIARILEQGGRCWYACPLKALSNSKYAEFSAIFGDRNVGILTGDRKENPDAAIIIGTTEILRNQLYDSMYRGKSLSTDFVVLDEAHFLGDEDRGMVWEEIMIYLPTRIPLLMLSATIGNARQIANWLSSIRLKNCEVVEETVRPVPLYPIFLHPSGTLLPLASQTKAGERSRLHKKVNQFVKNKRPRFHSGYRSLPPFGEILQILKKYDLLPAIFFLKSRADCDRALDSCRDKQVIAIHRQQELRRKIETYVDHSLHIANHRHRWHLENLAVGAHHSGQLPAWKLVLEKLMTEGLLDAVFATSTVAAGVNFPARTVVFFNSDRFNGKHFLPLTPTEFHQMTGRAGRRGMDKIGFALVVAGRFMDIRLMAKLFHMPPSDVLSQIRISFSMVLNLLLSHSPDQIEELLKKSFANHLITKSKSREKRVIDHKYLWKNFMHHLNFLIGTGFVNTEYELTRDGQWASQLRVDQPLLIAEGFRSGVFPQSDPDMLAAVIASFVYDRESDDRNIERFVSNSLRETFVKVTGGLKPFAVQMARNKFEIRSLQLRPAATVHAWARGESWEKVIKIAEMEEGDLAMLIVRTADNLRHIRGLKDVFPEAAQAASLAIERIMREPVAVED